jgi:hypothetical protein
MKHLKLFNESNYDDLRHKLKELLLSNGGSDIIWGRDTEEEIKSIITKGKLYDTTNVKRIPMRPNQCHANCAGLSYRKKSYKVITGYAMNDGVWICHTWINNEATYTNKYIIETTPITFEEYFGYELVGHELDNFRYENY